MSKNPIEASKVPVWVWVGVARDTHGRQDRLAAIAEALPGDQIVYALEEAGIKSQGNFGLRHSGA